MYTLITIFLIFSSQVSADTNENYHVRETSNGIELITPYGKKLIMGDYAPDGGFNYNIQIPMSEIKPPPTPTPQAQSQAPTIIQTMLPQLPPATSAPEENAKAKSKKEEPEPVLPPKIIVEYDETDRMILEANRLYNKKKFYESTQVVEEILRKKPDYVRAWIMKGSLMFAQKQSDLAAKAWRQALVLEPNNQQVKSLLNKFK